MHPIIKFDPYNSVPVSRTPWAGKLIVQRKSAMLPQPPQGWPERIGESWEVSTDAQFPSRVISNASQSSENLFFTDLLKENPQFYLGRRLAQEFGSHCPLLLKWLSAQEPLSVQVHPNHSHPLLADGECGKPESWLVLDNSGGRGFIYLGFRAGLTQEQILDALRRDEPREVMHVVYPKIGDYISIPAGCVHATGPDVLIAEPQYVLPAKSGKTWRLSDWKRRYNSKGEQDPNGQPRELHIREGLTAIDWSLPQGAEMERVLITPLSHQQEFKANKHNPFPVKSFSAAGDYRCIQLIPDQFSLVTCWSGHLSVRTDDGFEENFRAGESGLIAAAAGDVTMTLRSDARAANPCCALFAFDSATDRGN